MANTFFKFKQFIIRQDRAAMKVCTDSCLFGAWIADEFKNTSMQNLLDIGSGTGLLSLMLAQSSSAEIDAVEINNDACIQTTNNFASSPWKERLKSYNDDILTFKSDSLYDLIVCNPPFYQRSLLSPHNAINQARHDASLQPEDLLKCVPHLLKPDGSFAVLLPFQLTDDFIGIANTNSLYVNKFLTVSNSLNSKMIRSMLIFSTAKAETLRRNISIKNGEDYSAGFKALLKNYYLAL